MPNDGAGVVVPKTAGDGAPGGTAEPSGWKRYVTWKTILALILLIVVVWFVIDRIRLKEPALPPQADIATQWSESVSRLGIEPLFPPQEDFRVGDVYVVISAYDDENGVTREQAPDRPLLRKSQRVGHLDLRGVILDETGSPVFAPTRIVDGKIAVDQAQEEEIATPAQPPRIKASVVAFPAITVRHSAADGATWTEWLPFSASRTLELSEQITIPRAETYGAPVVHATLAFDGWCQAAKTKLFCTDQFARKLLAYTTDNDVLEVRNNRYVYRISLKLVTRVYLAREIALNRSADGKVSGSVGDRRAPGGTVAPPSPGTGATGGGAPDTTSVAGAGVTSANGGTVSLGVSSIIYHRPVVFGFKSVTFALDPSTPPPPPTADPASAKPGETN